MLKKFIVENYKGFAKPLVFDLQAREYNFNKSIVKNGIVNKAIVYGKNGSGKTNLGTALFDIITHLTDKTRLPYTSEYINLSTNEPIASFKYFFQFDDDEVIYEYEKSNIDDLLHEKLTINGVVEIDYNYFEKQKYVAKSLVGDLNIELLDNKLSVIKYIYRNTPTDFVPQLSKMVRFCENMLWFRSLSEGNAYCGFTNGVSSLTEILYNRGKVDDFAKFLRDNGIDYNLKFKNINGEHILKVIFPNNKETDFLTIASTGTKALLLFYTWKIEAFSNVSFLFIDEFDAFLHYESAEMLVKNLNQEKSFQSVLTSHNTYLMQNKLTRPDCCFIMTNNKITNLFDATEKEIREAHNLEKMYINGVFNE